MPDKYAGLTVNERLSTAGLLAEYDKADARGETVRLNEILAKVNLRRDAEGMHWPLDGKKHAPNQ